MPGPLLGRIVASPFFHEDGPLELAVGDLIWFGRFAGADLVYDGHEYLVIRDDEVLARMPRSGEVEEGGSR